MVEVVAQLAERLLLIPKVESSIENYLNFSCT